jgi:LuxR family transcriptional regulator, maltose regulon positive regulatory protein
VGRVRPATYIETADKPLLISKLAVPSVPANTIERPRLLRALDAAVAKELTIVEAPAGWGKTVLLASWATAAAQRRRIAWLTAETDDGDDDFWRYLTTALTMEDGGPSAPAPSPNGRTGFLAHLAAGLARTFEPVTLIIDNLHQVCNGEIHHGLDYLLRHAAARLRMILVTRGEPPMSLHRWRVRDELTEIGPRQLAFTADETAQAIDRLGITLSDACLQDLHRRTEGWPAAVCLAALTIKERPPSHRFGVPAGDDPRIGDYLLAEVLGEQPRDLQEALLDASILDRVTSGLLDALTGRLDGQRLLIELWQRGAYVTPVDEPHSWYRLNPLLSESLRGELRRVHPTRIRGLHARAAAWFADHDQAADALRHALASEDRPLAASILVQHWYGLLPSGHRGSATAEPIDPPRTSTRADPLFALAYAAGRLGQRDWDGAEPYLRLAEGDRNLVSPEQRELFATMTAAFRLTQAELRGDVAAMTTIAHEILRQVHVGSGNSEPPFDDGAAAIALQALGTAEMVNGQLTAAEATLREGHECAVAAGMPCAGVTSLSRLSFVLAMRGELGAAERTASEALEQPPCPGQTEPIHCAFAYLALAAVDLQRDRLDDSQSNLEAAVGLFDAKTDPALAPTLIVVRAQLLTELGDWAQAREALLAGYRAAVPPRRSSHLGHLLAAAEAELLTARGDPVSARNVLRLARDAESPEPALRVAYARACLRERDDRAASAGLPTWSGQAETDSPTSVRISASLIQAQLLRQAGDRRGATDALERALELAEPEDFRRAFTGVGAPDRDLLLGHLESGTAHWSFLADLLRRGDDRPGRGAGSSPGVAEPLTERELTVLRYLQSVLSNVEIAGELRLSVNTVKTHVRNIYRKLSARHRRDAVRRARELQLL